MKYKLIYGDPAWHFRVRSKKGENRSAKNHYKVMPIKAIKNLPIPDISDKDSACLMWVIDPMIEQGYEVMKAWGFTPKTVVFYWVKLNRRWEKGLYKIITRDLLNKIHPSEYEILMQMFFKGLGYYTRANPEQVILGTRGKGLARIDKSVSRLIVAPIGRHSAKPIETYDRIERLFGDVPRVELFARNNHPGWDSWGNQVSNSIKLPKGQTK